MFGYKRTMELYGFVCIREYLYDVIVVASQV